jgi:long-subunit acyl-CoA synthetase (AMP-forming)
MLYDALVFNKFKAILGGRVRVMITGSAPISKEVLSFLKIAFCCQIHEGYGQTECGAPLPLPGPVNHYQAMSAGPYPPLEIKLVDVPDMNYTSEDKTRMASQCLEVRSATRATTCLRGTSVNLSKLGTVLILRDGVIQGISACSCLMAHSKL